MVAPLIAGLNVTVITSPDLTASARRRAQYDHGDERSRVPRELPKILPNRNGIFLLAECTSGFLADPPYEGCTERRAE